MFDRIRSRLTFANVISLIALFIALGGGAYAVSKGKVKKIADKEIKKKAPGLSVDNADKLDGQDSTVFQTASASDQPSDPPPVTLGTADTTVLSTTITIPSTKTVTAVASVEALGNGGDDDTMLCRIEIAGTKGAQMEVSIPDTSSDRATLPLNQSRSLGVGTHTVLVECVRNNVGAVEVRDRSLSVVATG